MTSSRIITSIACATLFLLAPTYGQPTANVLVGRRGDSLALVFTPDVITAPVDSLVRFQFFPQNHSVARSSFESPCNPLSEADGGFFSDFQPVATDATEVPTFTVQVKDGEPIYLYCTQGRHCQAGMVAVINPRANETLEAYRANAMAAPFSLDPGEADPPFATPLPAMTPGTTASLSTSTSIATSAPQPENLTQSKSTIPVGVIVGIIGGVLALMAIILIGTGFCIANKRKKIRDQVEQGLDSEEKQGTKKKKRPWRPFWKRGVSLREIDTRRRMPNGIQRIMNPAEVYSYNR